MWTGRGGINWEIVIDIYTLLFMKQQGSTTRYRELCSVLYNNLYWKRIYKRVDACICATDSHRCMPETNTILRTNYTPIKNSKTKKWKPHEQKEKSSHRLENAFAVCITNNVSVPRIYEEHQHCSLENNSTISSNIWRYSYPKLSNSIVVWASAESFYAEKWIRQCLCQWKTGNILRNWTNRLWQNQTKENYRVFIKF